jgi:hypothetical protein
MNNWLFTIKVRWLLVEERKQMRKPQRVQCHHANNYNSNNHLVAIQPSQPLSHKRCRRVVICSLNLLDEVFDLLEVLVQ